MIQSETIIPFWQNPYLPDCLPVSVVGLLGTGTRVSGILDMCCATELHPQSS